MGSGACIWILLITYITVSIGAPEYGQAKFPQAAYGQFTPIYVTQSVQPQSPISFEEQPDKLYEIDGKYANYVIGN